VVHNARPYEQRYRMADSGVMYFGILPAGGQYWRLKNHFILMAGKISWPWEYIQQ